MSRSTGTDETRMPSKARTQFWFGERLRRERRRREAREHLRAALATFDLATRGRGQSGRKAELQATGEHYQRRDPTAIETLTPQELQVARQVADGRPNRDVAAALVLSTKTVEVQRAVAVQGRPDPDVVRRPAGGAANADESDKQPATAACATALGDHPGATQAPDVQDHHGKHQQQHHDRDRGAVADGAAEGLRIHVTGDHLARLPRAAALPRPAARVLGERLTAPPQPDSGAPARRDARAYRFRFLGS
jgi:hypothetical protein